MPLRSEWKNSDKVRSISLSDFSAEYGARSCWQTGLSLIILATRLSPVHSTLVHVFIYLPAWWQWLFVLTVGCLVSPLMQRSRGLRPSVTWTWFHNIVIKTSHMFHAVQSKPTEEKNNKKLSEWMKRRRQSVMKTNQNVLLKLKLREIYVWADHKSEVYCGLSVSVQLDKWSPSQTTFSYI